MIIKSDNEPLQTMLFQLEKLLADNGAWFHPDLSLVYYENVLSVEIAGPCPRDEIIVEIPEELLVPSDALNISIKGDKFVLNPDESEMSAIQLELGKLMFDIYNATDRVALYKKHCPWLCFREAPELMNRLSEIKTPDKMLNYRCDFLNKSPNSPTTDEFICHDFLNGRIIGHKGKNTDKIISKIMPIVDYFQHDYRGEIYIFGEGHIKSNSHGDSVFLSIKNRQPFPEQHACYVSYGTYDAVDTFMYYGFMDYNVPFLYSIPLKINIPGTDGLTVNGFSGFYETSINKRLEDIKNYIPIINKSTDCNGLILSNLVIPLPPKSNAMRRILRASIKTLGGKYVSKEFVFEHILEVEKFVIEENISFYESLLEEIETDESTPEHLKDRMHRLVSTQLNKLYKYVHIDSLLAIEEEEEAIPQVTSETA